MNDSLQTVALTEQGMKLQSKLVNGASLKFTKIQAGSNQVPLVDLRRQKEIIHPKQDLYLQKIKTLEDQVEMKVLLENTSLEESYILWQIGIYAEDPEEGEILYCIGQMQEGKLIPNKRQNPGYSITWNFQFKISEQEHMSLDIHPAGLISVEVFTDKTEEIEERINQLNENLFLMTHPIGSVLAFAEDFDPNTKGGVWERFAQGKTLVGVSESDADFAAVRKLGGNKAHLHSTGDFYLKNEHLQAHSHTVNSHTHSVPNHTHTMQDNGKHRHDFYVKANAASGTGRQVVQYSDGNSGGEWKWGSSNSYEGSHHHTVNSSGACTTGSSTPGTSAIGGGQAHNHGNTSSASNLQPYITVYYWMRTA